MLEELTDADIAIVTELVIHHGMYRQGNALIKKMENEEEKNRETDETADEFGKKYKVEKRSYENAVFELMETIKTLKDKIKELKK